MIFRQHQQALDGTKTQTRRLCEEFDQFVIIHDGSKAIRRNGRLLWQTGRTYAVQPGRGRKAVGRIRITKIRRERVQDISEEDAKAEGIYDTGWFGWSWGTRYCFSTVVAAFRSLWNSIHTKEGERFGDNPEVWALTFEVA